MWTYVHYHLVFVVVFRWKFLLTEAEVWPKPQSEEVGKEVFFLNPATFKIKNTIENCSTLWQAASRYEQIIKRNDDYDQKDLLYLKKMLQLYRPLQELQIYLMGPCEFYPQADMDENYFLTVARVSKLRSNSVWGILRGLETFAQLFEVAKSGYMVMRIRATKISDYPRYAHRGFLIDTARHHLSLHTILTHLEAMAMNKYNVLHWHITDAESFPYQSAKLPELSLNGAFDKYRVYNQRVIRKIVDFAASLGIRVVPEIDMPGHTISWGYSHPEVMVNGCQYPGTLNPTTSATYNLIKQLIEELRQLFPDKCMHLGGDEVPFECWNDDDGIVSYMRKNRLPAAKLFDQFIWKTRQFLPDRIPIYWEDVFTEGANLTKTSLVQIWKDFREMSETVDIMSEVMRAGLYLLYSRGWYLDPRSRTSLESSYQTDPRSIYYSQTKCSEDVLHKILGGEACLWGEEVDDYNFFSMLIALSLSYKDIHFTDIWSLKAVISRLMTEIKHGHVVSAKEMEDFI